MSNVKALCFDTGGTILDWHTGMQPAVAAVGARHVDFRLSSKRDVAAAKAFFRKAIKGQGSIPRTITLDG